jgi:hypothetical protein
MGLPRDRQRKHLSVVPSAKNYKVVVLYKGDRLGTVTLHPEDFIDLLQKTGHIEERPLGEWLDIIRSSQEAQEFELNRSLGITIRVWLTTDKPGGEMPSIH